MGNFFKTVICVLTALIVLAGAAFWGLAGLLPAVDIEDSLRQMLLRSILTIKANLSTPPHPKNAAFP